MSQTSPTARTHSNTGIPLSLAPTLGLSPSGAPGVQVALRRRATACCRHRLLDRAVARLERAPCAPVRGGVRARFAEPARFRDGDRGPGVAHETGPRRGEPMVILLTVLDSEIDRVRARARCRRLRAEAVFVSVRRCLSNRPPAEATGRGRSRPRASPRSGLFGRAPSASGAAEQRLEPASTPVDSRNPARPRPYRVRGRAEGSAERSSGRVGTAASVATCARPSKRPMTCA